MAAQKLTKKDLKQDSFVDWAEKTLEFLQANATSVGIVLLVAVVLLVGGSYVRKGQQAARAEASYMLYQGQMLLGQGDYAIALGPLQECVEKHGGTEFGKYARLSLVQARAGTGDHANALVKIDEYLGEVDRKHPVHADLKLLQAYVLADAGQFAEAAAALEVLTTSDLADDVYYERSIRRAEWLSTAGEHSQALSLLEELESAAAAGELDVFVQDLDNRLEVARVFAR